MLSIRLLGATEVQLDDKRLTIRRRKSRALLYYLAAHPEPVSRNRLLSTLWADHTADTARSNLRSTLYNLRRELGEYLQSDTETVWLAGELWVDVRAAGPGCRASIQPDRRDTFDRFAARRVRRIE